MTAPFLHPSENMRTQNRDSTGRLCPSGKKREHGSWMAKTLFPAMGNMWRGNMRSFLERTKIVDVFSPNSVTEVEFQCLQPFSIPVQPSNAAWWIHPHQMFIISPSEIVPLLRAPGPSSRREQLRGGFGDTQAERKGRGGC